MSHINFPSYSQTPWLKYLFFTEDSDFKRFGHIVEECCNFTMKLSWNISNQCFLSILIKQRKPHFQRWSEFLFFLMIGEWIFKENLKVERLTKIFTWTKTNLNCLKTAMSSYKRYGTIGGFFPNQAFSNLHFLFYDKKSLSKIYIIP